MEPLRKAEPQKPKRKLEVIEKSKARPSNMTIPLYRVIFHNDDRTSFQFVEFAGVRFFQKEPEAAKRLALEVHEEGAAIAGVYALEHAELRRDAVVSLARANGFPFQVTIEPEI